MIDIGKDLQRAFADGYAQGKQDAVKRGRWKLGKSGNDFIGYPVYNCSVCGYWNEDVYGFLYCPNCGADMRGE